MSIPAGNKKFPDGNFFMMIWLGDWELSLRFIFGNLQRSLIYKHVWDIFSPCLKNASLSAPVLYGHAYTFTVSL